ncbi:MAG: carboxypeptidase regulatory-like domain-containing protein [Euryarchaeota archaeon]|nr:carboxypeptidase regulatory-like domain-containing protein [Euryarchaeota archaeon]
MRREPKAANHPVVAFTLLSLAFAALAGCVAPTDGDLVAPASFADAARSATSAESGSAQPSLGMSSKDDALEVGAIKGIVVSEDYSPVAAASVILDDVATTKSNPDGSFSFARVGAGTHLLRVQSDGHANKTTTVSVAGDVETKVELVLTTLERPRLAVDTQEFPGFFECTLTYIIITGDCFAPVTLVAETGGIGQFQSPTNAAYSFNFSVGKDWQTIVMELVWENAPAMTSGELQLNIEPNGGDNLTESDAYAVKGGKGPVRLVIVPGVDHETSQAKDHRINSNGEDLRARIFLQGAGHAVVCDPNSGRCFLGLGAAAQQHFTLYVSTFYGQAASADYSVLD